MHGGNRVMSTFFMLFVFIYVFGLFGWFLLSDACHNDKNGETTCDGNDYFGSLPDALLSLFQMITFDAWASGICRKLQKKHWWAFFYYMPYQLVVGLLVLNVVTAVVVDVITEHTKKQAEEIEEALVSPLSPLSHLSQPRNLASKYGSNELEIGLSPEMPHAAFMPNEGEVLGRQATRRLDNLRYEMRHELKHSKLDSRGTVLKEVFELRVSLVSCTYAQKKLRNGRMKS
eukprot:Platyproteum_vivax@DN7494_c0_g1_i18.p1